MSDQTQTPNHKSEALELLRTVKEDTRYLVDVVNAQADQISTITRTIEALVAAMSQPAPAVPAQQQQSNGQYSVFTASELVMSYDDKGQPTYKIKGGPYVTYGVRVWPEVLPALGINPEKLKPGPNSFKAQVRVLMGEKGPRKVLGLATNAIAPDAHLESSYDERTEEPPF